MRSGLCPPASGRARAPGKAEDARREVPRGPGAGSCRGRGSGQGLRRPAPSSGSARMRGGRGTPQPGLSGQSPQLRAAPERGRSADPAAARALGPVLPPCGGVGGGEERGVCAGEQPWTLHRARHLTLGFGEPGGAGGRGGQVRGVFCFSSSSVPLCALPSLLLVSSPPFSFLLPLQYAYLEFYFLFSLVPGMTHARLLRARNLRLPPRRLSPLSRPSSRIRTPAFRRRLVGTQSLRPIQTCETGATLIKLPR